jgi:Ca2+-binding RTX toxin-like protein
VLIGAALSGTGNALDNTITGNALANTLKGEAGHDTLDGGAGADVLQGGIGNDLYRVDNASDEILEATGDGYDSVEASVDYVLGDNVERLILLGAAIVGTGNAIDNTIVGNALANSLAGGEGNDTLDGGAGADTLAGGDHDDAYLVDDAGDVIVETFDGGYDSVRASGNYAIGDNVEQLTLIGAAVIGTGNALDNTINGNAMANSLVGGEGADTLDGGEGADTLEGGSDNDFYHVDNADDVIVEDGAGGYDIVHAVVDYVLGEHVEKLVLLGAVVAGTGNAQNNLIIGNDLGNSLTGAGGDDTLEGGAGGDTLTGGIGRDSLVGGIGNDVYVVDDTDDIIDDQGGPEDIDTVRTTLADYTLGAGLEALVILNDSRFNVAQGNGLANDITTGSNDDYLYGYGGNDTLRGGLGNDAYFVGDAGDVVIEAANSGYDSVFATVDFVLPEYVERLVFQSRQGLLGTGNSLDNSLSGWEGNDTLIGGAGNDLLSGGIVSGNTGLDSLVGGTGNDTYVVDRDDEIVVELAGEGTDLVQSSAANYTLSAHVENLTIIGTSGANGYGNSLGNILVGNSSGNILDGGGGNDTLDGGGGRDGLRGGLGRDTFVFSSLADLSPDPSSSDALSDFDHSLAGGVDGSTLDVIDLSRIDPIVGGPDNAFSGSILMGSTAPGQQNAGYLYYNMTSGILYGYVGVQGMAVSPSFAITVGTGVIWNSMAGGNIML